MLLKKEVGEERRLALHAEGMIVLEKLHLANIFVLIDSGKAHQWMIKPLDWKLIDNKIFKKPENITSEIMC